MDSCISVLDSLVPHKQLKQASFTGTADTAGLSKEVVSTYFAAQFQDDYIVKKACLPWSVTSW